MATLTATQLSNMRRKLSDPDGDVFTDDELNAIFTEADSDFDTALMIAFEELLYDAAKFADYTAGQTQEKKSQVFDHLSKVVERLEVKTQKANQARIVGVRVVPPRDKDVPR